VLGLRRPPSPEELAAVPGIAAVEQTEETLFRIQFSPGSDPTDALVSHAGARDWRLYRIAPAQNSLEDVFVNLTRHEENN
jgi:ABC-2 type transport system ATP-binding protein